MTGLGFAPGVGFIAGPAATDGDSLGVGEGNATGFASFTDDEATSFHSLFCLAKVSTKRYWPLTSTVRSGALIFPFVITMRPVTTAPSLSRTFTFSSFICIESRVKAPDSMNFASSSLAVMLPSQESR